MIKSSIEKIFHGFAQQKVLIIGDVMIDSYIFGHVDRISPEAPVPVVAVQERTHRLGGAANVALNVKALGAQAILCSVIGQDDKAQVFLDLIKKREMSPEAIVQSKDRITTTKFRIIGNATQMLRVDEEMDTPLNVAEEKMLLEKVESVIQNQKIDVIIFQDYDKGVLSASLIAKVVLLAGDIPTVVDPKKRNFHDFKNVSLFKPNLKELREGINEDFQAYEKDKLQKAVEEMQTKLHCERFFTTLSEYGVLITEKNLDNKFVHHHIEAQKRNIADVSGAGDTVISCAALCLAQQLPAKDLAYISNMAGGLVCEEVGVVPVNKEKLFRELLK
ncbi:MAG: D-glycero-beta-D-manno-heptose-7-phosphate kinase [Bacteroidetes bacterium 4572_77]|nr:MAG: D-glycero-beta-D-manno-heptose-7-phosphate kinase [Bacteroidetes bacterium 4572_77]